MKICGPKLSVCGLIISTWGIIQLALMGIFYYRHSIALLEDVKGLDTHGLSPDKIYSLADTGFSNNAMNCWVAACLYILTLVLSVHQFYINSRNTLVM